MPGQSWQLDSSGGFFGNPLLSKNLRTIAQPMTRFRQFCDLQSEFGAHEGSTLLFDKILNIDTQGGKLAEGVPVPRSGFKIRQGSVTASMYGNSISWTEEFDSYSEFNVNDPIQTALINDAAKYLDKAAYEAFSATKVRYVPLDGKAAGHADQWSTDGTAPTGTRREMTPADFVAISDALQEGNYGGVESAPVPAYDSKQNYVCIGSISALRALQNPQGSGELSMREDLQYGDPSRLLAGEVGTWSGVRFVSENHLLGRLKNADGTDSGLGGEAFMFGKSPAMEIQVTNLEVRKGIPGDFGRDRALAAVYCGGFGPIWEFDAVNEPENRVVKIG